MTGIAASGAARDHAAMAARNLPVTYRGVVYCWHMDHMGHMNVQHYAGMFDHASWVLMSLVGLDAAYFRENHRGLAAVEQNIGYQRELRAGDTVEIRSSILEVNRKTMRIFHSMWNTGSETAAAHTTIVAVHFDTLARKGVPLPAEVCERARSLAIREEGSAGEAQESAGA